ncbi:MAG: alpha/beta hydrolase [Nevskiales bacterium]|nr:alpha/beta hydrolase [Nevskiales bacterium]
MRRLLSVVFVLLLLVGGGLTAFDRLAPHESAALGADLERGLSQLQRYELDIDGFHIVYLEGGSGDPLVLVHGFGADKDNFTRAARSLTSHYRVIIPDLPGFGESSKPTNVRYRIQDQVERLDQIMQALGLSDAHFGGSSMGGWIVAAYAAQYPAKTDSLWLLDPGGVTNAKPSPMIEAYEQTGESPLLAKTPEDFDKVLALVMEAPPLLPYGMRRTLGERAAADHDLHAAIFKQLIDDSVPLQDIAPRITAPTLIVWGDKDRVLDISGGRILEQLIPGSRLLVMPGIGHLPMLEAPKQAAADYLAFRNQLGSTATAAP